MTRKIYEIDETDKNYPKSLLEIKNNPKKIYVMGNLELLQNKAFAIVGTRENTDYGEKYAKKFAEQIAKTGITIVSGLANGIDSIAHKNAMKHKGKTIAVIGSGFHSIYPKENEELFKQILENDGCIISEYAPETEVDLSNFPTRNRIIAGLSKGVLVVEAKFRSGSSITARYGFEQKKPVFCIPNRIGEKTGVGTNNLIKIGAKLVTSVNEILIEIGEHTIEQKDEVEERKNKEIVSKKVVTIEKNDQSIYKVLETGPIEVNELAKKLKQNIMFVNQRLTMMEIEGIIETLPGNLIKRKE